MAIFEGAGVALITPFKENGEVNFEKLEELVEEQIAGGTDAIIACGTTGESSTMTHEEDDEVIRFICNKVNHRIPVIAGTGSNCTREAVSKSIAAEKAGADGLLVVTPYYNKATQKGLIQHFTTIANAVSIPVILYHIPGRTGVTMKPETIVTLCKEVPNIVGVKEASGDFSAIAEIMHLSGGEIDVYSGNDDQIVPLLAMGGKGVISVLSNVAPRQTHEILLPRGCGNQPPDAVRGSAPDQCIVLRGEPDSCKGSFESDGKGSRPHASSSDYDGGTESGASCKSDARIWYFKIRAFSMPRIFVRGFAETGKIIKKTRFF